VFHISPCPFVTSELFDKKLAKLQPREREDVFEAIEGMTNEAPHFSPGLGIDKIESAKGIKPTVWEARANKELRMSWQFIDIVMDDKGGRTRGIFYRNVDHHDRLLKSLNHR
jgi:hypothetical protein